MAARIFQTAKERLLEIWDYTERTWGEEQADTYVRNLIEATNRAYVRVTRFSRRLAPTGPPLIHSAALYAKSDDLVLYAKFDSACLYDLAYTFGMYLARDPKQLGNIIRRARKRLGLSQKQLGEKTAMRQATISLLETGNAAARLENLLTVLAALDLELQVTPRAKDWDKEMENYL